MYGEFIYYNEIILYIYVYLYWIGGTIGARC